MALTLGKVVRYSALPGILPRLRDLFLSFTTQLSGLIALAFAAVRLLPPEHPYLIPANAGRFGIRDTMAAARANLVFRRENTDQIILYYTISIGLILLMLQAAFFVLAISLRGAHAGDVGTYWSSFFVTPEPAGDIAFMLLDHVFGVPDVFGSCVNPDIPCPTAAADGTQPVFTNEGVTAWPTPVHTALQAMFNFYNLGVACVGIIIFLYLVATTIGETAQSGKPFGARFNRSWAIPRMMLAVALLTPLSYGLNGAQWITLYVAKWGSGMATNAWITFNEKIAATTPLGDTSALVPNPTAAGYNDLPEFMMVARTCKQAEAMLPLDNGLTGRDVEAYQVIPASAANPLGDYFPWPGSFDDALTNSKNSDIVIVFGEANNGYINDVSHIHPICGQLTFKVHDLQSPGAMAVQRDYYNLVNTMWTDTQNDTYAQNIVKVTTPVEKDPAADLPDNTYIEGRKDWFETQTAQAVTDGRNAEISDPRWTEMYTDLGWAGASIWYNRIAEYNGSLIAALRDVPKPSHYPDVMEYNAHQQGATQNSTDDTSRFCLPTKSGYPIHVRDTREFYISQALCKAQSYWSFLSEEETQPTGSPVLDILKKLFGVKGLFEMQNNVDVSPLAQLVGIGRDMINTAELALGGDLTSVFLGLGGKALNSSMLQILAQMLSQFSTTVISICLAIGFVLYYVLPFMPFIYVFFALGGWVKAIFQAMVGLPLWALAHIRIDGDGIPGPAALDGYFMLFEIFVRPIVIIFALVASVSIFSAEVQVLSQIWTLVITNLAGYNTNEGASVLSYVRDAMDTFAYTILYAVVVYLLALSSFKLIDLLPSSIMRWLGKADLRAFGLGEEDSGGQFMAGAKAGVSTVQGAFGQGVYGLLFGKNKK